MGKFFVPTAGPEDWKKLLAEPEKHWRSGYSAKALAYCWEDAGGFPASVKQVLSQSGVRLFEEIEFLVGFPEWKTPLRGGSRPSQSDIFVLARSSEGLISITVEGKVAEPFGPTVGGWKIKDSPGKRKRFDLLCRLLGLSGTSLEHIRYQLLHRTASALIEAERFNASAAIMLVHSFSQEHAWFEDYQAFLKLFDKRGAPDSITYVGERNGVELYLSWVTGEERYLKISTV